jgi:hypothetical protein
MDKFNEKIEGELIRFYQYLIDKEVTVREAGVALQIYPPNLCRYKARYEKEKVLIETGKRKCSITGFTAATLTTNPETVAEYFNRQPQLSLAI